MVTKQRVLIAGAGKAGEMVLDQIRQNSLNRNVVGFLDDDPEKLEDSVNGVPILGRTNSVDRICLDQDIDEVIIAMPSVEGDVIQSITRKANELRADLKIVPGIREIIEGDVEWKQIREVHPEDLLGRETAEVNSRKLEQYFQGKTILVTGASGSIGGRIVKKLMSYSSLKVLGVDFNESDLYQLEVSPEVASSDSEFLSFLCDIRDKGRLKHILQDHRPDIILHAAALKHVPMCERFPCEAVKTNINATINLFEIADEYSVQDLVLISTDKAVEPVNVMGYTKKIGEQLVGNFRERTTETNYSAVRFGNVLASRGSVVPIFKRQIQEGGPVTVTDPEVERYFMTLNEAIKLVLKAGSFSENGFIYLLKMGKSINILNLAEQLISLSGFEPYDEIPIEFTGLRNGEKISESLQANEESFDTTSHPKIIKTKSKALTQNLLNEFQEQFEQNNNFRSRSLERVRNILE